MFLTLEKLSAYTAQIHKRRCQREIDLFPLYAADAGCETDEVIFRHPGSLSKEKSVQQNDFFLGRDRYLWLQAAVTLPELRQGKQLIGSFDFGKTGDGFNSGFESLLYIDGKPHQGVDTFHNEVVLDAFAGRTVELTFLLWTGLEGGGVKTEQTHRLRKAEIGYLDLDADALFHYADAIVKSVPLMPENSVEHTRLPEMLNRAFALIDWDEDRFYDTIKPALTELEKQLADMPKNHAVTVHCVGHTHIDVAWLWRLKHTREKAVRSFSTALRLMEQNDDFLFLQSQPQLYSYIKQDCPEIYEQIKKRIGEGRWEADGGMWLEADCNITSGEALVRQFLHGCNFIQDEFGHACTHLWLPDVFGYSWALPQILKQCGIKTFATTKISWNQYNRMPHDLFWWRGIDGSEVLTYFVTTPYEASNHLFGATYNGMLTPFEIFGTWSKFRDKNLTRDVLVSYGHGDGGGGVTTDMLKRRRTIDKLPGTPNIVNDTAGNYFETIHRQIAETQAYQPVWDGELYLEYHRGTFTSQAKNKKWNRKLELKLAETEWLASHAMAEGNPYPQQALHSGWETVLRNQFHDIIPGSSIREVYEDSEKEYGAADAMLNETRNAVLGAVTAPGENVWTLWSFAGFDRKDLVFVPEPRQGSFTDADQAELPSCPAEGGYLVKAPLRAMDVANIHFRPDVAAASGAPVAACRSGAVETARYAIEWNQGGQLVSIYDKENGREVLAGQGNRLEIYEDKPLRFDAWDIDIFHLEKCETVNADKEPELIENNGLRAVLRTTYAYRKSHITQDMILYADSGRIDFVTTADWHEDHRLLKAAFDANVRATKATYDIQFGYVERPTHFNTSWDWARFEVVGHKWADISDSGYGVSLLNDCKYGYSAKDSTLRISLLKSAKEPDTEADMGTHSFTYALLPHNGNVLQGGTIEESVRLNLPSGAAKGAYKAAGKRLFYADNARIAIDAVKRAEKADCFILRMHETSGSVQQATIRSDYDVERHESCNLLEQGTGETGSGCISSTFQPFEIKTFQIWLSQPR